MSKELSDAIALLVSSLHADNKTEAHIRAVIEWAWHEGRMTEAQAQVRFLKTGRYDVDQGSKDASSKID